MTDMTDQQLQAHVRTIPDYPKPGILFRDVSTLLLDGAAFRATIERMMAMVAIDQFDLIAGIEARGFITASALAFASGKGKLMLRKSGKLPGERVGIDYALEYGTDRIEMHVGAVRPGQRVLLTDDLLATGGTALAGAQLLRDAGAIVDSAAFIIDLPDLGGGERLQAAGIATHAVMAFAGH